MVKDIVTVIDITNLDIPTAIELVLTAEGDCKSDRVFESIRYFYESINQIINGVKLLIKSSNGKTWSMQDCENKSLVENFFQLFDSIDGFSNLKNLYFSYPVNDIIKMLETQSSIISCPKEQYIRLIDLIHEIRYSISECILFESLQRSLNLPLTLDIIENLMKICEDDLIFMRPSLLHMIMAVMYSMDPFMNANEVDRVGYLHQTELIHPIFGKDSNDYIENILNFFENKAQKKLNFIHLGLLGLLRLNFTLIQAKIGPFLSELNIASQENSRHSPLKYNIQDDNDLDNTVSWTLQNASCINFINRVLLSENGKNHVKNSEPSIIKLHMIISDLLSKFPIVVRNLSVERTLNDSSLNRDHENEANDEGDSISCIIKAISNLYDQFSSPLHARLSLDYWWPESCDFNENKTSVESKEKSTPNRLKDLYKSKTERESLKQTCLLRFLRQVGEIASNHRSIFKIYLEMLKALVNCSAAAELCFQHLCSSSTQSNSILSWDHFIGAMMKYFEQYNSKSATNSTVCQMKPEECEALIAVVRLIRRICNMSPKLSVLLCEDGNLQLIQLSMGLLSCPIPPQLKAEYILLLATFSRQNNEVLGQRIWQLLISNDFIRFTNYDNKSQSKGGLIIEIEEIEPKNGCYPITRAFLSLISSLVPVITQTNPNVQVQEDLKLNIFSFITENIFLRHNMRLFNKPNEKNMITSQCLYLFHQLLDRFIHRLNLVVSIEENVLNNIVTLPPDWPYSDPGFFIAQQILSGSHLFKMMTGYLDYHLNVLIGSLGSLNRESQSLSWINSLKIDTSLSQDVSNSFSLISNSVSLIFSIFLRIAEHEKSVMNLIRGEISFNVPSTKSSESYVSQIFLNHCKTRSSTPVVSLSKLLVSANFKGNKSININEISPFHDCEDYQMQSTSFLLSLLKYATLQEYVPEISLLSLDLFMWVVKNFSPHNQILSQLLTTKKISDQILSVFVNAFQNDIILKTSKGKPYILGDSVWLLKEMPNVPSFLPSYCTSLFDNQHPAFDQIRAYHYSTSFRSNRFLISSLDDWEDQLSLGNIPSSFISDNSTCCDILYEGFKEKFVSSRGKILSFILSCFQKYSGPNNSMSIFFSQFLLGFDVSSSKNLIKTTLQDAGVAGTPKTILHCCLDMIGNNYIPLVKLQEILLLKNGDDQLEECSYMILNKTWQEIMAWNIISLLCQNYKSTGSNILRFLRNNHNLLLSQFNLGQLLQDQHLLSSSDMKDNHLALILNTFVQIKQTIVLKAISFDIYDALNTNQRHYVLKILSSFLSIGKEEISHGKNNISLFQSHCFGKTFEQFNNTDRNLYVLLFARIFDNIIQYSRFVNKFFNDVYKKLNQNDEVLSEIVLLSEKFSMKNQENNNLIIDISNYPVDGSEYFSIVDLDKFSCTIDHLIGRIDKNKTLDFDTECAVKYQSFVNFENFFLIWGVKAVTKNLVDFLQTLFYASEKCTHLLESNSDVQQSLISSQSLFNKTHSGQGDQSMFSSFPEPLMISLISFLNDITNLINQSTEEMKQEIKSIISPPCPLEVKRFIIKTFEGSIFSISSIFPSVLTLIDEKINKSKFSNSLFMKTQANKEKVITKKSFSFADRNIFPKSAAFDLSEKILIDIIKNIFSIIETFSDLSTKSATNFYSTIINFISIFESFYSCQQHLKENDQYGIIYRTIFQIDDGIDRKSISSYSWLKYLAKDLVNGQHRVTRMVSSSLMSSLIRMHDSCFKTFNESEQKHSPLTNILSENAIENIIGQIFVDLKCFIEIQNEINQLSRMPSDAFEIKDKLSFLKQQLKVRICEFLYRIQLLFHYAKTRKGSETIVRYELITTIKDQFITPLLRTCFDCLLKELSELSIYPEGSDFKSIRSWLKGKMLDQFYLDELQKYPTLLLAIVKLFQLFSILLHSLGSKHNTLYIQIQSMIRDISDIILLRDFAENDSENSRLSTGNLVSSSILMHLTKSGKELSNSYFNGLLFCYLEFSRYLSTILHHICCYRKMKNKISDQCSDENNDPEWINHHEILQKARSHCFAQIKSTADALNYVNNLELNVAVSQNVILFERLEFLSCTIDLFSTNITTLSAFSKFNENIETNNSDEWLFYDEKSLRQNDHAISQSQNSSFYNSFARIDKNDYSSEKKSQLPSQRLLDLANIIDVILKLTKKSKMILQLTEKYLNSHLPVVNMLANKNIEAHINILDDKTFDLLKFFANHHEFQSNVSSSDIHLFTTVSNQIINLTLLTQSQSSNDLSGNILPLNSKKSQLLFDGDFNQNNAIQPSDSHFCSSDDDFSLNEYHFSKLASITVNNHKRLFGQGLSSLNQLLWLLVQQSANWLSKFSSLLNNGRFKSLDTFRASKMFKDDAQILDSLISIVDENFLSHISNLLLNESDKKSISDHIILHNEQFLAVMFSSLSNLKKDLEVMKREVKITKAQKYS